MNSEFLQRQAKSVYRMNKEKEQVVRGNECVQGGNERERRTGAQDLAVEVNETAKQLLGTGGQTADVLGAGGWDGN
ncbi:hypothetical protein PGTUg99_001905 [Puccinia graminis f. sp. tritici]|uniref:Uncharacterized protein n=1 Tax=Puccinia graminis f. sp. tritici TaxID=56615 RepID=A0A5B0QL65_PUCGR|nr:hypothetical protein PGTUg99_001905 [Puccinia graminis f. sp. tritici]